MTIASVIIAVAALLFTITSFWWIHARRGKLRAFPPRSFSGYLNVDSAGIRLPLSIFNDGAIPIVVTDLRLRLQPTTGPELLMHSRSFRRSLRPEADDVLDFAHPWCVPGRAVVSQHVEFASIVGPGSLLDGQPVKAVLDGTLGQNDDWTTLAEFPLHTEIMAHPASYITYSNQEHVWEPGLREEAAAAHTDLKRQIRTQSQA